MAEKSKTPETVKPAFKYEVVSDVTLPVLKQEDNVPMFIKLDSPVYKGEAMNDKDGKALEPADLSKATNLETGEIGVVVMNTVLKSAIEKAYPDNTFVGKCFRLERAPVPNKRYKAYKIQEIKVG